MSYTRHKYMGYEDLSHEEYLVIAGYFLNLKMQPKTDFVMDDGSVIDDATYYRVVRLKNIDSRIEAPSDLDVLLRSDKPLSTDMRRFIADVIAGKTKIGRPTTTPRDRQIYKMVRTYVSRGISLSSSENREGTKDGAAAMAIKDMKRTAEARGLKFKDILSEGVVKAAYTKIENEDIVKDKENPYLWVVTTHYKDNGDIEFVSAGYVV